MISLIRFYLILKIINLGLIMHNKLINNGARWIFTSYNFVYRYLLFLHLLLFLIIISNLIGSIWNRWATFDLFLINFSLKRLSFVDGYYPFILFSRCISFMSTNLYFFLLFLIFILQTINFRDIWIHQCILLFKNFQIISRSVSTRLFRFNFIINFRFLTYLGK